MTFAWKSARTLFALASISGLCSACGHDSVPTAPSTSTPSVGSSPSEAVASTADKTPVSLAASASAALTAQAGTNGSAGETPAYYEGQLFTVNMKEQPASESLIAKNANVNEIYASNDLDDEQDFIPVIDAIQGEGFNPLWRQILIVFNQGFTPHQFHSEDEINAAAAGSTPEITLVETDEVYRCSVVGKK